MSITRRIHFPSLAVSVAAAAFLLWLSYEAVGLTLLLVALGIQAAWLIIRFIVHRTNRTIDADIPYEG